MKIRRSVVVSIIFTLFGLSARFTPAGAAEIKIFTSRAVATVLAEIGPQFQAATGHKLDVVVDLTPTLLQRVRAGEQVDIIVALPDLIDGLIKDHTVIAETRTDLVRSGLGVEVREGMLKPDISTVAAFTRAVVDAKSVGYLKTPAGVHLDGVFASLGISEIVRSKAVRPDTDIVSKLVAQGEIELGIVVATQILTTPGVELVGRLPEEIQYYVAFVGGVTATSNNQSAASDLLKFLKSPAAISVIKSQGMEPR